MTIQRPVCITGCLKISIQQNIRTMTTEVIYELRYFMVYARWTIAAIVPELTTNGVLTYNKGHEEDSIDFLTIILTLY